MFKSSTPQSPGAHRRRLVHDAPVGESLTQEKQTTWILTEIPDVNHVSAKPWFYTALPVSPSRPPAGCRDTEPTRSGTPGTREQGWGRKVRPSRLRSQFLDESRCLSGGTCPIQNKLPVVEIRQRPSIPRFLSHKKQPFQGI